MGVSTFLSFLTSSPIFLMSGFVIGFLSFIGMIYFYIKGKEERTPCYFLRSTNVFRDLNKKFKGLKVTYDDEQISNLTVTTLIFWNSGAKTIRNVDVAPSDPLVLKVRESCKILNIKILNNTTKNNYSTFLESDYSSAKLMFDYIDKNEGIVVQITHTGDTSSDIKLSGTIIGSKGLIKKNGASLDFLSKATKFSISKIISNYNNNNRTLSTIIVNFPLIIGSIGVLVVMFGTFSTTHISNTIINFSYIYSIFDIFYYVLGIFLIVVIVYILKTRVPNDFNVFFNEIEF